MKITKASKGPEKIKMRTRVVDEGNAAALMSKWWEAENDMELATRLCGTASYLKTNQSYRLRQLAVSVRLYSGLSVYSYAGSNVSKMDKSRTLPDDRPTFNIIESTTDTLVSRLTQNEPQPKFLTDRADYKKRHLAQDMNYFILGEFYQTDFYEKASKMLRDGCIMGSGILKVYRGYDDKVKVDRVMATDLYVDENDSLNGDPQQMIQLALVDRECLFARTVGSKEKAAIANTPQSYPDNAPETGRTVADQVMVVEGWKLPTGDDPEAPGYVPGRHTIATTGGVIFDEEWHKPKFPFVVFNYSEPFIGYWGQGLGTRLFGTQISINRIMYTISRAINLVGVPRVFVEMGSKVSKAHNNNEIGVIIPYSGVKPSYEVAPCNAPELYAERDKLIEYGYRQEGISDMQATGKKPAGLDSGEAIRSYDDINSDRSAELAKKYERVFIDAAYLMVETAMEIAKETGKYQTVYPKKDGTREINLPDMAFLNDPFVIKCFTESSLPRTPAGRIAAIMEQLQTGMLTIKEARSLMKMPDLEENAQLNNASEERIFQILDKIVEKGEYTMPDEFMDLDLATLLVVQYLNLYLAANLEEEKADLLRKFFTQVQTLKNLGQPPALPAAPGALPTAPGAMPPSPQAPSPTAQAA